MGWKPWRLTDRGWEGGTLLCPLVPFKFELCDYTTYPKNKVICTFGKVLSKGISDVELNWVLYKQI